MHRDTVRRIVRAYDDPLVRGYSWARFVILRQRFLDRIGEHLPRAGRALDVGCGFGLFSLYYAQLLPGLEVRGIDRDGRRIELARRAARRLGVANVSYERGDAACFEPPEPLQAAYLLDIVHHVPAEVVPPLLARLHRALEPGGRLVVKDVATRPAWKRWFTHALDRAMAPRSPVRYWPSEELEAALASAGFRVRRETMPDFLPYPHVLYVCERA